MNETILQETQIRCPQSCAPPGHRVRSIESLRPDQEVPLNSILSTRFFKTFLAKPSLSSSKLRPLALLEMPVGHPTKKHAMKAARKSSKMFEAGKKPRSMKEKQQKWILSGLRKVGAPGVPHLQLMVSYRFSSTVSPFESFRVSAKVCSVLATMMFALPHLSWCSPTDHCELFSGEMSVTMGELQAVTTCHYKIMSFEGCLTFTVCFEAGRDVQEGRVATAYDVTYSPMMDMCTPEGFCLALFQCMNLKRGAGMLLAPVCSTWVWMQLANYLLLLCNQGLAAQQADRSDALKATLHHRASAWEIYKRAGVRSSSSSLRQSRCGGCLNSRRGAYSKTSP